MWIIIKVELILNNLMTMKIGVEFPLRFFLANEISQFTGTYFRTFLSRTDVTARQSMFKPAKKGKMTGL